MGKMMKITGISQKAFITCLMLVSTAFSDGPESFSQTLNGAEGKSPQKAMLYSAVLPGAGQWYAGSPIASAIYTSIEIAAISGYFTYTNKGVNMVSDYEKFADNHWDVFRWLQGYYSENATEETHNVYILLNGKRYAFKEFIESFSSLPDPENNAYDIVKEYHFYENIGKYKQFKQGWDDYEAYKNDPDYANTISRSSPNQENYTQMRYDANIYLKRSGYFASALLFNHVISAMDAGLRIHRKAGQNDISILPGAAPILSSAGAGAILKMEILW
jgi:hypothetical protein